MTGAPSSPGKTRRGARAWFLDFDHTLFDTDEFFHVDVRRSFLNLGVDDASWERSYATVWHTGYTLGKHAEEVYRQSGSQLPLDEMKRILTDSFSELRRYLFPDVRSFLERGRKTGVKFYLLSFGDAEWQRYKLLASHIRGYFEGIFLTAREGGKAQLVRERARGCEQVVVVDNNPAELDLIKDVAPAVETYWLKRVPDETGAPGDELSRLRFFEARSYAGLTSRHQHTVCRSLDDIGFG